MADRAVRVKQLFEYRVDHVVFSTASPRLGLGEVAGAMAVGAGADAGDLAAIRLGLVWLITSARWPLVQAMLCMAPGALMPLALRAALTGHDWRCIALLLLLLFLLNLADMALRTQRLNW